MESRFVSERSDLIFDPKLEGTELVEHFQGLVGIMQEKFIDHSKEKDQMNSSNLTLKQYVRFLKTDQAHYTYKTGLLKTDQVEIAHYVLTGKDWPHLLSTFNPIIQGHAQSLQLSVAKGADLKAQGFQANFYDLENEE